MRRYSLFILIFILFIFLAGIFEIQVYFSSLVQRNRLVQEKIDANVQTLQFLDRTIFSPAWHFRRVIDPLLTEEFLEQIAGLPSIISIEVTDSSGGLFMASDERLDNVGLDKAGVIAKMQERRILDQRMEIEDQSAHLLVYKGEFDKVFWLVFDHEEIDKSISNIIRENTIIGLLWLALFAGIFFIIVSITLQPLRELRDLFNKVREGNLDVKAKVTSRTEIGELAETFNRMVDDLKKSKEALEETKTALEIKVAARTRELKGIVDGLEAEVQRRTQEVYERMKELEKFQNLAIGRELKMIELKKELRNIKENLKKEDKK